MGRGVRRRGKRDREGWRENGRGWERETRDGGHRARVCVNERERKEGGGG